MRKQNAAPAIFTRCSRGAIQQQLLPSMRMTSLNWSARWTEGSDALRGYRILRIGLEPERQLLYARINQRAQSMFDQGLVTETEALLEKFGTGLKVFDTLGYRQAAAHLRGECSLETAIQLAQQGHRNYAKRQLTWFRREPDVHWLHGFGDQPEIMEAAEKLIRESL